MTSWLDVSTQLTWLQYLVLSVFTIGGLWLVIAPDRVAWKGRLLSTWDGHRGELSLGGLLRARLVGGFALVFAFGFGVYSVDWTTESRVETAPWRAGAIYDVGDPVESPGCAARVVACLVSDAVFPIPVSYYDPFPADGLRRVPDDLPSDTDLVLYVEGRFFPTQLVLDQDLDRVTVSVYGKCSLNARPVVEPGTSVSDCQSSDERPPRQPGFGTPVQLYGVVPVSLGQPLAGRPVIDGLRGTRVLPDPID